jgi:hypothetical protein
MCPMKGPQKDGPLPAGPPGSFVWVCCRYLSQASERSGGGQDPQSSSPDNRLCPVVNVEFAIDIAGMGFDRVQ